MGPTTAYSAPPRPSALTRPSRMVTVRSMAAATSASWVTTTTVVPRSSRASLSSSTTRRTLARSSWLVGSSASSRGGLLARATATARRCCSPPDRARIGLPRWAPRSTASSSTLARFRRRAAGSPASTIGRSRFSQAEACGQEVAGRALPDEPEPAAPEHGQLGLRQPADVDAVQHDPPGRRPLQAAQDGQHGRLARPRRPQQGDHLAPVDPEVDPLQGHHLAALQHVQVEQPLAGQQPLPGPGPAPVGHPRRPLGHQAHSSSSRRRAGRAWRTRAATTAARPRPTSSTASPRASPRVAQSGV